MPNPYADKGPNQFWRSAVAELPPRQVRPTPARRFAVPGGARIATAGSCFAQEVGKALLKLPEVEFFQTERNVADQPMFSALYGNIYTARQLRQLYFESLGLTQPIHIAWQRDDGRWVDAMRPAMFREGFDSPADVAAERDRHLSSVRRLFTECAVFIFTLGLTEAWVSSSGDTVFPIAPGVVAEDVSSGTYRFHNFTYDEVLEDVGVFIDQLLLINPNVRCILTVSPVPLVATFTDEHVLVATTHSKSILRAVCSAAEARWANVFYFPSYEIISGHYNSGAYYNANKRTIAPAGVEHVMEVFRSTYFPEPSADHDREPARERSLLDEAFEASGEIICDEELVVTRIGF
jgi:hypothetical protein